MYVRILFAVMCLLTEPAFSQTSKSALPNEGLVPTSSAWAMEGLVQAHSVAGPGSPWLGIAGSYSLLDWANVGMRGFLPISQTVDESTYSLQAFVRARVARSNFTHMFIESDFAQNFYEFLPFSSYGLGIGVISQMAPRIGVGVIGGVEVAGVVLDSVGLEHRNSLFVYPKVSLLANFGF